MSEERPDKLSIVVFSGDFDKVHYALVLASGAAAIDIPVTLFFTMEACRALAKPGTDGAPAWRNLPTTWPIETCADAGAMDDGFKAKSIATFEELMAACAALDVRFIVCEMGLKAVGIAHDDLRDDLPLEIAGVVTLLNDASRDGTVIFV